LGVTLPSALPPPEGFGRGNRARRFGGGGGGLGRGRRRRRPRRRWAVGGLHRRGPANHSLEGRKVGAGFFKNYGTDPGT